MSQSIVLSTNYGTGIAMNGRIFSVNKWHRVEDPLEALKILVKSRQGGGHVGFVVGKTRAELGD